MPREKSRNTSVKSERDSSGDEGSSPGKAVDTAVTNVFTGDLQKTPQVPVNVVKLYICSNKTDFELERQRIWAECLPELQYHFLTYGIEVEICDVHQGSDVDHVYDRRGFDRHLDEIHECYDKSVGPFFVALVGDKYGPVPLPAYIEEVEFQHIRTEAFEAGKDVKLLDKWYLKDTNHIPPAYFLQPVSSEFEYFDDRHRDNASRRAADRSSWQAVFHRLQDLLQHAASVCYREGKINQVHEYKQNKYFQSGMAQQVYHALDLSPKRCLLFSRGIDSISMESAVAKNFIDTKRTARQFVDKTAQEKLTNFKNDVMLKLNTSNQYRFEIGWQENGLSPCDSGEHADYLDNFQTAFTLNVKIHIERYLAASLASETVQTSCETTRHVYYEAWTHLVRCQQLSAHASQVFPELEVKLKHLLASSSPEPVLIYGPEGCGKSVLVSKLCEAVSGGSTVLAVRYVALTPGSRTPWDVLHSICWQLDCLQEAGAASINHLNLQQLVAHYKLTLKTFSLCAKPLVIVLDGVDNFRAPLSHLDWLTCPLPENVRLFLTCSTTQSAIDIYERLKGRVSNAENLLQMSSAEVSVAKQIIGMELADEKRTLTKHQEAVLTDTLQDQSRLLFLKLIECTCLEWTSITGVKKGGLPKSVQEAINSRFRALEKRVSAGLAGIVCRYISAAYFGITEMELLDLLSCNNDALLLVLPPDLMGMLRFPHWYWLTIKMILGPLIEERWINGKIVHHWSHPCVATVASHRYRATVEDIKQSHRDVASLYLETWVGNKPFVAPELGLQIIDTGNRFICQQPLLYSDTKYNLRRTTELWYQLLMSGDIGNLKENALCNFEYLLSALHSTNVKHLLYAFETTFKHALDAELVLLHRCIILGEDVLAQDPLQLASEIIGRLRPVKDKFSVTIDALVQQCMEWCDGFTLPLLVPLTPWLSDPRGSLVSTVPIQDGVNKIVSTNNGQHVFCVSNKHDINMYHVPSKKLVKTFTGHTNKITCLVISFSNKFILTGSADGSLRMWEVSAENNHNYKLHRGCINQVAVTKSDDVAMTASADQTVKMISLPSGEVLHTSAELEAPVTGLAMNRAGSMLVTAAGNQIQYWSADDLTLLNVLEDITEPVFSLTLSADNIFLLLGCADDTLHVRSFTTGSEVHQLSGHKGKIASVAISCDSYYCVVGGDDCKAYVYNLRTTELLETLSLSGPVSSVIFNHNEHFIYAADQTAVNIWTFFKQSTLKPATFNHVDRVTTMIVSTDGKSAVTGSRDKLVKMWNLEISDFTENLQGHEEAITCVALAKDDAFAVSGSLDTTVKVWSIMMGCVITDYKEHCSAILSVHVLGETNQVMSAEQMGIIKVWLAENGTTLLTLDGPVDTLHTSPNGQLAVSGDKDKISLDIWEVGTGTLIQGIVHKDKITCVTYSQDSQYMVTGSEDKSLKVWEAATGKLTQVMVEHGGTVNCVAVTDNNKHVISGCNDKMLYVWGLSTGAVEHQLVGHTDKVNCVRVTKDGSSIISGSYDGTLRVWNFTQGTLVTAFDMHTPVLDVMITVEANRLMVKLEDSPHVPLLCLHNSPAAEVKSQSQISIQVNGDTPILPLRPRPLRTQPYSAYFTHKRHRAERDRVSVSSIPDIIKVSPIKAPLQKAVKAQEHNRETRSMSILKDCDSKAKKKKGVNKDNRSGVCLIL